MRYKFRDTGTILKSTIIAWCEKDPFRESAIIAYYAIFSIPALLVIVISLAGIFFGKEVLPPDFDLIIIMGLFSVFFTEDLRLFLLSDIYEYRYRLLK